MSFFKAFSASVLGFFAAMFIIVLLTFGLIAAMVASIDNDEKPHVSTNSVLEIDLTKTFEEYSASEGIAELTGAGGVTLRELGAAVDAARDDDRIAGIRLKSSGSPGTWAVAEEIRRALDSFRTSGKFVVATVGERGVSEGSYYIASAADSIVMVPGAHMEMNGIAAALPFFKPALDRLGIQAQVVRAGAYKGAVEPFILDSASAETMLVTRELVEGTFARFRSTIAEARGISPLTLQSVLSTKGIVTSHEAKSFGLVDAVMYEDQIDSTLRLLAQQSDEKVLTTISLAEYAQTLDANGSVGGGGNRIAIVYAVGEIHAGKSGAGGSPLSDGQTLGNETFAEAMRTARQSKSVKAVVVRIDSPGGEAGPSEAMWREIKLTSAVKPVIASMGSVAASGGYFLAAACDTIVAEENTITGSIGVFGLWFTIRDFMRETAGINVQVVRSDSLADMGSMLREPTDLERAILQKSVDTTYQKFLRIVSEGRGITLAEADSVGQGRVYTGARAKQLKLVDELGGLGRAIEIAASRAGLKADGFGLEILPERKTLVEAIVEMFTESTVAAFFGRPVDLQAVVRSEIERRSGLQMLAMPVTVGVH